MPHRFRVCMVWGLALWSSSFRFANMLTRTRGIQSATMPIVWLSWLIIMVTRMDAACAESFGAVCMLCAERLLPIGCIIGQQNLFAKSPVPHRCSWLASSLGTEKKCTAIFAAILPQFTAIYRNFTPIFFDLGDRNLPPPPGQTNDMCRPPGCLSMGLYLHFALPRASIFWGCWWEMWSS